MTSTALGEHGSESRGLGEQERLLHYMHGFGALISVTVLHMRGPLSPSLVRAGLDHLQRRHPMLRAHIRYRRLGWRSRPPFIVAEPELDTRGTTPVQLIETGGDWREVIQHELRTPLPRGRNPRLRATLLRPDADGLTRLILSIDHGIADAQATVMAVRDLMSYMADPSAAGPTVEGLPPALETRYRKPSPARQPPYQPAIRLPFVRQAKARRETHYQWRKFTLAETGVVRDAARAHRTTMHGTMSAALLQAVHERYGLPAITALSTVEHRRLCRPPLPAETFGCYIDIIRTRHVLGGPFWSLAQDIAFRLIATLAKDQEDRSILQLPGAAVYRHETLPTLRTGFRLDGIGVTSAGETGMKRAYGAFVLEDVTMLISMHVVGPGIFAVGLEREGALELGLCYAAQSLSAAAVAGIADRAAAILRQLPE